MEVRFVVNNYMLGAKARSTPTDKIVSQNRIDPKHTEIVFDINERENKLCEKVLAKRGVVLQ